MCYDTWKTTRPDNYDYDPYEDYIHVDEVENYEGAKDWLKEILHHVYLTGDIHLFENALGELCGVFDIKIPKTDTKLQKKRSELFDFAVQLTRDYAKITTNEGENYESTITSKTRNRDRRNFQRNGFVKERTYQQS